jgi:hypothetical protein
MYSDGYKEYVEEHEEYARAQLARALIFGDSTEVSMWANEAEYWIIKLEQLKRGDTNG